MQRGGTVNDYTVTIGQGLCEDLRLSANSLHCKPQNKEPCPGAGNPGKGQLRVYVCLWNITARDNDLHISLACFKQKLDYILLLSPLQMQLGYDRVFIGLLKYESDGLLENPAVRWGLIGGAVVMLTVIALLTGCCIWARKKKSDKERKDAIERERREIRRVNRQTFDVPSEYLTQHPRMKPVVRSSGGGKQAGIAVGYLTTAPPGEYIDAANPEYLRPNISPQDGYLVPNH